MAMVEFSPFGAPLSEIAADALALESAAFAERYGAAFFVRLGGTEAAPRRPTETRLADELAPPTGDMVLHVLPVVKRRASTLAFISVGRLQGNDIAIADPSVSKLHAIIREREGGFFLEDAESRNGTMVEGVAVPARGMGPPTRLTTRCAVRFGSVHASFLDAAGLIELARRVSSVPRR